jgi:hypothetical protein
MTIELSALYQRIPLAVWLSRLVKFFIQDGGRADITMLIVVFSKKTRGPFIAAVSYHFLALLKVAVKTMLSIGLIIWLRSIDRLSARQSNGLTS